MNDVRVERRCVVCNGVLSESNQSDQCRRHLTTQERRPLMRRISSKLEQDQERVHQAVEELKSEPETLPLHDLQQVLELVARSYGVTAGDILGHSRVSFVIRPRQVLMYLLRTDLKMSYPKIGEFLDRDHSTVTYSCRKILGDQTTDSILTKEIRQFQEVLAKMLSV